MSELTPAAGSPFDAIRRVDEQGEYWSGRDLMPLMEYARWDGFMVVIEKAKTSLALVQGDDVAERNLRQIQKVSGVRGPARVDYRLTRFGAYLVAMAGDDTKPAVAQARIYFAVRAREAELAPAHRLPANYSDALRELAAQVDLSTAQAKELETARPKVEYVDNHVRPADATTLRVFAGQLGVGEQSLRSYLCARDVLYRRLVGHRWSTRKGKREPEYQWLAKARYAEWFVTKDQPEAPRMHNGQLRTTLYVTAVGKIGIRRMIERRPIVGQDDLDIGDGRDGP